MATRPSSTFTKAKILEAYEELDGERQVLENQISVLKKELARSRKQTNLPLQSAPAERPPVKAVQEEKEASAALKMTGVTDNLAALRNGFAASASELSEKLSAEAARLQELREQIGQRVVWLKKAHDLDPEKNSLDGLIETYDATQKTHDEELAQKRRTFEEDMSERKNLWQNDRNAHQQKVKERDEIDKKTTQRELAEYDYQLKQAREKDGETFELEKREWERTLKEMKEAHQQFKKEREAKIAEREIEFNELRAKVEKFPKTLEAAVKKAGDEAGKSARQKTDVSANLRAKEAEGERRIFDAKIASLEQSLAELLERRTELSAKLEAASKQAQTLASKAIEGAENMRSFDVLKEVALQQRGSGRQDE